MITKLLNEVNEKIETLNNLVQDKEYFEKLDERIEKINNYVQEQKQEIERLNNIINELEKDFERKIQSCTIEAETTTNDFYCRLHIAALKRWLNKIKELKGDGSNEKTTDNGI